jgi:insulysin
MIKKSNIIVPSNSTNIFEAGILKNNIKYVLVEDENITNSYVSVCVNVGSFNNPKEYQGLAHFLEHMLFLGSKKYPDEYYYADKISKNGGSSNAYTSYYKTVYYFNVLNNNLVEILDIFSRFFIDPLFNESSVLREVNAVNSEHEKNINDDYWRIRQVFLNVRDKDNSTNTFPTGSLETLNKPDIREQLIKFYNTHYVSSNIALCIISSHKIKKQLDMINNTFGLIESKPYIKEKLVKPFFKESKTFFIKSLDKTYYLIYSWEINVEDVLNNTFNILIFMLRNSSEKSIKFYLINNGLIENLYTAINSDGVFQIMIYLTKYGYKKMSLVEEILFNYINNIFSQDIKSFAEFYQKYYKINFDNLDKIPSESLANTLSVNLFKYDLKTVFSDSYLISNIYDNEKYINLYKKFIRKDNFLKFIASRKYKKDVKLNYLIDKHYGTKYCEIDNNKLSNYDNKLNNKFNLILNDEYLNIKPKLIENLKDKPILISNKQWYSGYSKFLEPKVNICLIFNNKLYNDNIKNYVLSMISISILNLLLKTLLNDNFLFYEFNFSFDSMYNSILLYITGFNDVTFIKLLINSISNILLNISKYNIISDKYIKYLLKSYYNSYKNIKNLSPWELNRYYIDKDYDYLDIMKTIKTIKNNEIYSFINNMFIDTSLTSYICGNINKKDCSLFSKFNNLFSNKYFNPKNNELLKSYTIKHPNKKEKSHSIIYSFYIGKYNPRDIVIFNLIKNILSTKFYDELRTKEQLGYIVNLFMYHNNTDYYIFESVQSSKDIQFVKNKMNKFNDNILNIINNTDINIYKKSLKKQLEAPEESMDDLYYDNLNEIIRNRFLFNIKKLLLKQLETINKDDIINSLTIFKNMKIHIV